MSRWNRNALYYTASLVACLVLWQLIIYVFDIASYILPSPVAVGQTVINEWGPQLMGETLVTAKETVLGLVAAVVVGVPLAIIITYSRFAEKFLYPIMVSSQVVPKVAVAPLLVVWFGFGLTPKVLTAFIISFFVIVVDTAVGLRSIEPQMLQLGRSMGGTTARIFWKIRLPNALPNVFGGLKVGVTLAVVGAVVGEFVGSGSGLGYVLLVAMGNVDTSLVFACIVLMAAVGIALFLLVEITERIVVPWQRSRRLEEMTDAGTA